MPCLTLQPSDSKYNTNEQILEHLGQGLQSLTGRIFVLHQKGVHQDSETDQPQLLSRVQCSYCTFALHGDQQGYQLSQKRSVLLDLVSRAKWPAQPNLPKMSTSIHIYLTTILHTSHLSAKDESCKCLTEALQAFSHGDSALPDIVSPNRFSCSTKFYL